ncbi:hypothetical protein Tco_1489165, partial [Tanacetum coccineum]
AYEEEKRRAELNQKFEEDKRREEWNQQINSDKVEKEVKDIGFIGALVTGSEVADGYGGENQPQIDSILKNLNQKALVHALDL